jgi:Dolichyl-phosphate-mannose-protein mannosyltransferase
MILKMRPVELVSDVVPAKQNKPREAARFWPVVLSPWLAFGIVAFGAALRVARYLSDRSLWLDESLLAINLTTRSYRGLLETLDFNQGAPIGFLWAERLVLGLLGDSEFSLRLFPLLVGLAALLLFYLVAREVLQPVGFLVALLLFATMEPFVRYSAEVKQYGLDVAVTLALVYLYVRLAEDGQSSVRRTFVIALAGPLAVWLSHPSVFVLAGFATATLAVSLRRRDTRALVHQAVAYGVWLLSFLVVYVVAVRDLRDLQATVRGVGSGSGGRFKNLYTIFNEPGAFPRTAVGLAAAVTLVGVIYLSRRRPGIVVLFAATMSALLAAGYLGAYPVGQRFLLFLLPLMVLCLGEGVAEIARHAPRLLSAGLLLAVTALILAPVVGTAAKRLVMPPKIEEIEPLLDEVAGNWHDGDVLYLYPPSQYAFRYYVECSDCSSITSTARKLWPSEPTVGGQAQSTAAIVSTSPALVVGTTAELDREKLAGRSRVWLLYTHFFPRTEAELLQEADRNGTRLGCTHGGASLLCLYDFSRRPARTEP